MREYGGYLELDTYRLPMLHNDALALNCGRKSLEYLLKARHIKRIRMPYFMCDCVFDTAIKSGTQVSCYHIDQQFMPIVSVLDDNEWLYVMNYYGQLTVEQLEMLKSKYHRIIVDNAQAYFDIPLADTDTLYTCRKFFGVADGAFLYTDAVLDDQLSVDESFERMHFVLGRYERPASEFYAESAANNDFFDNEPIRSMSKLTYNLLHAIDYSFVKQRRTENFRSYHELLADKNQLNLRMIEGAFAYPLFIEDGARVRKALQQEKIYIPTLWPNVVNNMPEDSLEYRFAQNILPLPCDQRYSEGDIEYITEVIKQCLSI